MKYFGLIVLGTLVSSVSYGAKYDDNAITGSCTQTLGGKKRKRRTNKRRHKRGGSIFCFGHT